MNIKIILLLSVLISGCASQLPPLKVQDLPYSPREKEVVVYIISPSGYFAPYEYYIVDINGLKSQAYFGGYTYITMSKPSFDSLSGTYQFNSRAKVGYSDEVKKIHHLKSLPLTSDKDIYYLIRDGGEFVWCDEEYGLQEMANTKFFRAEDRQGNGH